MATNRVLIISHEVVGEQMAGPGIRYYNLARVLSDEFVVTLAVPPSSQLKSPQKFAVITYETPEDQVLGDSISRSDVVIVPAIFLGRISFLWENEIPVVVDGYDPFLFEALLLGTSDIAWLQKAITQACLRGDFFICASIRQRSWWLGLLEANGRINPRTIADDKKLRWLVDLVPFGIPSHPPKHTRPVIKGVWPGVEEHDKLVLWGGGLWPWFDPFTAIRAIHRVWRKRRDVKLVFPGTQHPNPRMRDIPTYRKEAIRLAEALGLLNKAVFFGEWIAYQEWPNALLESDVALSLHYDTAEAELAFRTRILDYIWAGLPTIATCGDETSSLIRDNGLGAVVDFEDDKAVAEALLELLEIPKDSFTDNFERVRNKFTWERVSEPLRRFCRDPRPAPDKGSPYPGNSFYREKIEAYLEEITRLEREVVRLKEFEKIVLRYHSTIPFRVYFWLKGRLFPG